MTLTKWEMFLALSGQLTLVHKGIPVLLHNIEREDGSGYCYNLTLQELRSGKRFVVFCRTQD